MNENGFPYGLARPLKHHTPNSQLILLLLTHPDTLQQAGWASSLEQPKAPLLCCTNFSVYDVLPSPAEIWFKGKSECVNDW